MNWNLNNEEKKKINQLIIKCAFIQDYCSCIVENDNKLNKMQYTYLKYIYRKAHDIKESLCDILDY